MTTTHPMHPVFKVLTVAGFAMGVAAGCAQGQDGGGEDCPSDAEFFEEQVWKPFASMTCFSCHNSEGAAKDSAMVLRPPGEEGAAAYNMQVMAGVANEEVDGTSVLLLKPIGAHPDGHGGGTQLTPGTPDYAALEEFVARAQGTFDCEQDSGSDGEEGGEVASCEDANSDIGGRGIRRLSHLEYDNTVRDLVAVDGDLAAQAEGFASDNVINGFTNNADSLTVSGLLADQYRVAAEALADHIVTNQGDFLGCDPIDGEACAESFMRAFAVRAFRRPVTDEEVARYLALYTVVEAEDGFDEGLKWMVAAALQSPNFLYRTELGVDAGDGTYTLTAHEVASELSYLIVGTMPDAELEALAESGEILDPAVLEAQAQRLLGAPGSERVLARFVDEWLGIGLLPTVTRDPDLYPEFTPEIREAMLGETHRVVAEVFYSGGSLADLLTADFTHVTSELAAFYGVPAPGEVDAEGYGRVGLDGVSYGGLMTQGSVNAAHALPTTSSPIHRGLMVRGRLMCHELPPPPAGLDTSPPAVDPDLSTRERYAAHSSEMACSGCHELIDGIGFGLEHYDAIGRFREVDGIHPVDATGEIVRSQGIDGTFEGAAELQGILAGGDEVRDCYAQLWTEFALGAELEGELECVGESMRESFATNGGRLDGLVSELVRSPHFLRRQAGDYVPGGDTGGGDEGESSTDEGGSSTDGGEGEADTESEDSGGDGLISEGIEIEVTIDSQWAQGQCNTIHVYNVTDAPIDWEVSLILEGTLNNHWTSTATPDGEYTTFTGDFTNATVPAQGTTSFGYCVSY
ncbi:hypothetical protein PPSIR1_18537 [Plesiocystis pacifica SIR-1]|uniref:Cellulose-binding domain protein n=2 Tax=Plesiocystis pacifica TaxID=191768 RepID=A6GCR6_9BACT|nr:hypothetical protein PPSIR1_18537 [Plesiocystis pacifica SIR-1]